MKKIGFIVMFVLAVVCLASCRSKKSVVVPPRPSEEVCAVLGFQYGTNVTAEDAKDITDHFRVGFHPAKYKLTDIDLVEKELNSSGYKNKAMTKQQMCEVGRRLGARLVVYGTISKLMGEYSVDVQVVNVLKETTVAFEGRAFQKSDCGKEMQSIAKGLASKIE